MGDTVGRMFAHMAEDLAELRSDFDECMRQYNAQQKRACEAEAENKRLREALERAIRAMIEFGNITNWPADMPMSYAEACNEARATLQGVEPECPTTG